MPESASLRRFRSDIQGLPKPQLEAAIASLDQETCLALLHDWEGVWARENQLAPLGDWTVWLILAGRGFGKTRTGAEWIRVRVKFGARRIAVVGPTAADVRDVMVEGESGLLAIYPDSERPDYKPSKRRLTWPNGAVATCFSADKPDRLRGPQFDTAWADELAAWRYASAWDMLQFGLRLGKDPRACVTTTPRPTPIIKELVAAKTTAIVKGSTYDNADNLAPTFLQKIVAKYEGTRLGQQELHAAILGDTPGALWNRDMLESNRRKDHPELVRIVVAVDPSVSSRKATETEEGSNECGIVVVGLGVDKHAYVLEDLSEVLSPDAWAKRAVAAYHAQEADRIVAEVNNGGDLVETTVRTVDKKVSYKAVRASRGKEARAEPVAALYEQGRVHHVGMFAKLEDQQCTFVPGALDGSPDRVDALVWGITELMLGSAFSTDGIKVASTGSRESPNKIE